MSRKLNAAPVVRSRPFSMLKIKTLKETCDSAIFEYHGVACGSQLPRQAVHLNNICPVRFRSLPRDGGFNFARDWASVETAPNQTSTALSSLPRNVGHVGHDMLALWSADDATEGCNNGHGRCFFTTLTEAVGLDLNRVIKDRGDSALLGSVSYVIAHRKGSLPLFVF